MSLASLAIEVFRAFSCFPFCQYILIPGPVLDLLPTKTGLGRGSSLIETSSFRREGVGFKEGVMLWQGRP